MRKNNTNIGEMIRKCRTQKGITQIECARRAKIDNGELCKIEKGKIVPRADTLELICDALGVELAFAEKRYG